MTDDGSFFGNVPDFNNPIFGVNRSTKWEKTGNFDGSGFITFEQNEPEAFFIQLPDIDISIITSPSSTMDMSSSGLYVTANNIPSDDGYDNNYDVGEPLSFGSTDPVGDFSAFNNIIAGETGVLQSCVNPDGFCPLAPSLSLDFVRFTLEGTPTENGGDNFILRGQTSNASYLEIEFTTTAVPLPAGIYLFLSGLVGLGLIKRRSK